MNKQIELFSIENPCISVCRSNKKGFCFGCLRNRQERQLWQQMDNEQKRDVLRLINGRRKRIEQIKLKRSLAGSTPEDTMISLDLFDS